jgi:ABC-type polysaccharide/polyol phosphate export permease
LAGDPCQLHEADRMSSIMNDGAKPLTRTALQDLRDGFRNWELWGRLAVLDIKRRYRHTVIGPFWSAISLGIFVAAMGTVGGGLWNRDMSVYLPFLASGMLVWLMISSIIIESTMLFIAAKHLIGQTRFDYSVLAYALVWRNFIVFLHNASIYVLIVLFFAPGMLLGPTVLLIVPGLFFLMATGVWVALLVGAVCVRFLDVRHFLTSVIQICMFVTPVFWPEDLLQGARRFLFVELNPLYHFINVVRAPLLGKVPGVWSYVVVALITVLGWSMTYAFFSRFRKRIAFWS